MCLVRSPVSLDYRPPSTSPSRSLSLCLVFFLSLLPHTNTNQKPINSPTILPLPLPPFASPQLPLPSLYHSLMCAPPKYHEYKSCSPCVPPTLPVLPFLLFLTPLLSFLYSQAPPFNPCSPSLSCVRTGFLSADGVSLLCSFSSKGI